jgi:hypothetical protein
MSALIWGTLKRADNIYKQADKVISKAKKTGVLPSPIDELVPDEYKEKNCLIYCLRLGLTRIARVYILFVYLSTLILVVGSFLLWWWPQRSIGMLC